MPLLGRLDLHIFARTMFLQKSPCSLAVTGSCWWIRELQRPADPTCTRKYPSIHPNIFTRVHLMMAETPLTYPSQNKPRPSRQGGSGPSKAFPSSNIVPDISAPTQREHFQIPRYCVNGTLGPRIELHSRQCSFTVQWTIFCISRRTCCWGHA